MGAHLSRRHGRRLQYADALDALELWQPGPICATSRSFGVEELMAARERFWELRDSPLEKKPSTAELLDLASRRADKRSASADRAHC
jgi:hypothetical protein